MSKLQLYHGSQKIIQVPQFGGGKKYNDYGSGFYCTENIDLAKEWACPTMDDGFANCYELDTAGLKFLNLSDSSYCALHWLAVLLENRRFDMDTQVMVRGASWLKEHFLPDISAYDVITGWRADDSYFSFARAFLSNQISYRQLIDAMKLGKLGEQFVLKSRKAFAQISFTGYEIAPYTTWFAKRKQRDDASRLQYKSVTAFFDVDGLYLIDIIREEVTEHDPRLR